MGFNTFPCNPYPISTEELNKGNNDDLNTRVAALESDVSDLNSNKANQITIAPFFNAETAYTAGDLVYYNGLSYRCTNDHEGEWDADDFAATTIANELDALKSGLTNVQHSFTKRTFVLSAQYAESYYLFEQNIALDGWYPLSVASFRGSTVSVNISNVTVGSSENKLYCDVYNITGNTISSDYKVTVDVLYTKSIMI